MSVSLGFLLGMLLLLIFVLPGAPRSGRKTPEVRRGVLDLHTWRFDRDGAVPLSGEWLFEWGVHQEPTPSPGSTPATAEDLIRVPGTWNGRKYDGRRISGDGFATYRLRVILGDSSKRLGLKLLDMATAYRVYVNDIEVAAAGRPGKTAETTTPRYNPTIATFSSDSDQLEILVHVSNFDHWQGGMWESMVLGTASELADAKERALVLNVLMLGGILVMGLYHLGLNWLRKEDASSLYFGVFCLMMGIRLLITGDRYILHFIPNMGYEPLMKITYLSLYVGVPVFAVYMKTLFQAFSEKVTLAIQVVGMLLSVVVLLTPARLFTITMPVFQVMMFLLLIYGLSIVIREVLRKQKDAPVFLAGFLILFVTTVNDLLYTRQVIHTGHFAQTGVFLFIFSQAFLISRRFSQAFATIEEQHRDLVVTSDAYKREIENRKETEKQLIQSERKYRDLFNNSLDLLFIHDFDGNILETNLGTKPEYGWSAHELVGKNFQEMIPQTYHDDYDQYRRRILANGTDEGLLRICTKSGGEIILEYRNRVITDDSANPVYVHAAARDVTQRLSEQKALLESEEKFRSSFEASDVGMEVFDSKGHFISVNAAASRMLGYTREALSELTFMDVTYPEDLQASITRFEKCLADHRPYTLEKRYLTRDGKTKWGLTTISPLFDSTGAFLYAVAHVQDITERKQAEDELQQAHKMEAIGTLAGGIAHDFNNILHALIGYTELAMEHATPGSDLEDDLAEILTAGGRARELVQQILAYARQSDEKAKPIQVAAIARETVRFIRSSVPTTIEITQQINSESLIMGNATQVHQIFMNLCTNAAHAMEDTGGVMDIRIEDINIGTSSTAGIPGIKPGNYVHIRISDTGTGISSEIIHSIFEPYYTSKGPGEGTGLGLAVVKGIVESSGGEITVDSKFGEGTRFNVYLPITAKPALSSVPESSEIPTGTERILFVDDEAQIVKMCRMTLENLGYRVTTQTSSVAAFELFRSEPDDFDLVITDMTMPHMTGDKLAFEILKIRPEVPIVLCTGYSKKIANDNAASIGISALLPKPIFKANLAQTVRRVLDESRKLGS